MNDNEITKEYSILFNGITDAITELRMLAARLTRLHQQAEQLFIDRTCTDEPIPEIEIMSNECIASHTR